jgi:hypothetical protein
MFKSLTTLFMLLTLLLTGPGQLLAQHGHGANPMT